MNRKKLFIWLLMMLVIAASILPAPGCATTGVKVTKFSEDGKPTITYEAHADTAFQDFKGSNLKANLNPEGETTVEAGAVDNVTNAAIVDALGKLAAILEKLTPLLMVP